MSIIVNKKSILYDYLRENLNESKNTIKGFLTKKMVKVNGKIVTKYDYEVNIKDVIEIGNNFIDKYNAVDILYEDEYILAVDKPSNLLSIATLKEREKTLYNMVSNYVKTNKKNNKIFIVHRLDKDTSGIVIFAKSEKIKKALQENWNDKIVRKYIAIVHGKTDIEKTIKLKMKESTDGLSTYVDKSGEETITIIKRMKCSNLYSYLDVEIKTGKKNQIRVALSNIGNPILGDKKYGIKDDAKRMMLHAYMLEFIHPVTNKKIILKSNVPRAFKYIYKNIDKKVTS
jgi:RluA family pseudouridine synthase